MIQLLIKKQKGVCLLSSGWVFWVRLIQRASSLHTPGPTRAWQPISITVVVVLFCSGPSCVSTTCECCCLTHILLYLDLCGPLTSVLQRNAVKYTQGKKPRRYCLSLVVFVKSTRRKVEIKSPWSFPTQSLPLCARKHFYLTPLACCTASSLCHFILVAAWLENNQTDHFLLDPCAWGEHERVVLLFVDPNPSGVCGSEDMCVPVWDSGICSCSVWHLSFSFFSPQTLSVAFHLS